MDDSQEFQEYQEYEEVCEEAGTPEEAAKDHSTDPGTVSEEVRKKANKYFFSKVAINALLMILGAVLIALFLTQMQRSTALYKQEIRLLSKEMGLPDWDKPSFACLASRFVYGEMITAEKLRMVGRAEEVLREMGFKQYRVRIHGNLARIEVFPSDFERLIREENRERILSEFTDAGFAYVTMDLRGYRTGSMNEVL